MLQALRKPRLRLCWLSDKTALSIAAAILAYLRPVNRSLAPR